ncbi:MAG: cupin domain-containing protein [Bdellovibrionota bacterium]
MKTKTIHFRAEFRVAIGNGRSQAAEMVLTPGGSTGGPENRHRGADQWIFVLSGKGTAIVDGKRIPLGPNKLLLIERGEAHEITNTGRAPLRMLNFYVPPAYTLQGVPLPRAGS